MEAISRRTPKKFRLLDFYMRIMMFFPIVTIFPNEILTKVLFGILAIINVVYFVASPINKRSFYCIVIMLVNFVFALSQTDFPIYSINMYFYYPFTIVYTCFVLDKRDALLCWIKDNFRFINGIVIIWSVLVGISIFIPSSYYVKEADASYFGSFVGSIFRLGPAAFFIQTLVIILLIVHKNKKSIFYMIIPMYCFLMGSSRAYLAVGVLTFLVYWYYYCEKRILFNVTLIPLVLLIGYLVLNSAIGDKIAYTLDETRYGDFIFRLTSSRSVFWAKQMMGWLEQPALMKWLGSGLDFTYNLTDLWAHNDFVEILCSVGIVGLLTYIYIMVSVIKTLVFGKRNKKSIIVQISIVFCWFLNAFFNMHYVYFCCLLAYPLLLLAINKLHEEEKLSEENI